MNLPVSLYTFENLPGTIPLPRNRPRRIAKFHVFLEDRPGSLARFSSLIAATGGNIGFFHYDRAKNSRRVAVEIQYRTKKELNRLLAALAGKPGLFREPLPSREMVGITALENIFEIRVQLRNTPGSLARLARLLKSKNANVIYMLYDEAIDTDAADIAIAADEPAEVDTVLDKINACGYSYSIVYRGSQEERFEHVIGLKQVEKFFLRLKHLLSDADIREIRHLVDSSQDLHADLVRFYEEAGRDLAAGDIYEKVLGLASMAVARTGERFQAVGMLPLQLSDRVRLHGFRLPTSENIYLLEHDFELTMIDTGFGLYYEDLKTFLAEQGLDPARIKRIFITHPDADHIGSAGYFEKEFKTRIYTHRNTRSVMRHNNRGHGSPRLARLNQYFTRLVTGFTRCAYPSKPFYFAQPENEPSDAFARIDRLQAGDITFQVWESLGGHIPGQVFFVAPEHGLCFTSDFMINTESLSAEDREHLRINRDLLTSVNSDSGLFRKEMDMLNDRIQALNRDLKKTGRCVMVFPGHGNYYRLTDSQPTG